MNYYRKPIEKTINDVKLKMQIGALTFKITEKINKINNLLEVNKDIKKDIIDNSNSIKNMNNDITNNFNGISINEKNIKFKTDTMNSNIDEMKSNLDNLDLAQIVNIQLRISLFIILKQKIAINLVKILLNLVFLIII